MFFNLYVNISRVFHIVSNYLFVWVLLAVGFSTLIALTSGFFEHGDVFVPSSYTVNFFVLFSAFLMKNLW